MSAQTVEREVDAVADLRAVSEIMGIASLPEPLSIQWSANGVNVHAADPADVDRWHREMVPGATRSHHEGQEWLGVTNHIDVAVGDLNSIGRVGPAVVVYCMTGLSREATPL